MNWQKDNLIPQHVAGSSSPMTNSRTESAPLAEEDPRTLGIILLENSRKAARGRNLRGGWTPLAPLYAGKWASSIEDDKLRTSPNRNTGIDGFTDDDDPQIPIHR
jgi:hypothetical protein